jgi:hypothetical protein
MSKISISHLNDENSSGRVTPPYMPGAAINFQIVSAMSKHTIKHEISKNKESTATGVIFLNTNTRVYTCCSSLFEDKVLECQSAYCRLMSQIIELSNDFLLLTADFEVDNFREASKFSTPFYIFYCR